MIVGVAGPIGAGKDVIASHLIKKYCFTRIAFADQLKQDVLTRFARTLRALWTLNAQPGEPTSDDLWAMVYLSKPPGVRELLQEYGSEVRRQDDPDYWVKRWKRAAREKRAFVVAPDVRFVNEAQAIKSQHGLLLKVERPGKEEVGHASETGLRDWTDWDKVFQNVGTIQQLTTEVDLWWRREVVATRRLMR